MRNIVLIFVCVSATLAGRIRGEPPQPEVEIVAKADREQPTGWPLVIEVTLTNRDAQPITWWCGGPDVYPGAERFLVEVRYGGEAEWHPVDATNGQYVAGSGGGRALKSGESIVVPLAIPVSKPDGISFRIRPRDWHAAAACEGYVKVRGDLQYADVRRARVIEAAMTRSPSFWEHLAERYADGVVVDALLKLVTVDNALVVTGAARVLARQKILPETSGDAFAVVVARWLPRSPRTEWGGLREWVAEAALKTQSEPARTAVLKLMAETTDADVRWVAVNALGLSPGDEAWLRRARASIAALPIAGDNQIKLAMEWLDSRINYPQ